MRRHPRTGLLVALLGAISVAGPLAGCATTYDESIASEESSAAEPATSTTAPAGTAAELLPRLVEEASSLSGLMLEEGDAAGAAARVAQYWDAVKAEVNDVRPDLLSDFSANVARCQTAVQFKRAADADKAAKNLSALVDTFLTA